MEKTLCSTLISHLLETSFNNKLTIFSCPEISLHPPYNGMATLLMVHATFERVPRNSKVEILGPRHYYIWRSPSLQLFFPCTIESAVVTRIEHWAGFQPCCGYISSHQGFVRSLRSHPTDRHHSQFQMPSDQPKRRRQIGAGNTPRKRKRLIIGVLMRTIDWPDTVQELGYLSHTWLGWLRTVQRTKKKKEKKKTKKYKGRPSINS